MSDKLISLEEQGGPFQAVFQRVMRMVPDRDKNDKNLQRLLAFRLKLDGEAVLNEFLIRKIRETIKCAYTGSLYEFLKDDLIEKECRPKEDDQNDGEPPGAAWSWILLQARNWIYPIYEKGSEFNANSRSPFFITF